MMRAFCGDVKPEAGGSEGAVYRGFVEGTRFETRAGFFGPVFAAVPAVPVALRLTPFPAVFVFFL